MPVLELGELVVHQIADLVLGELALENELLVGTGIAHRVAQLLADGDPHQVVLVHPED